VIWKHNVDNEICFILALGVQRTALFFFTTFPLFGVVHHLIWHQPHPHLGYSQMRVQNVQ